MRRQGGWDAAIECSGCSLPSTSATGPRMRPRCEVGRPVRVRGFFAVVTEDGTHPVGAHPRRLVRGSAAMTQLLRQAVDVHGVPWYEVEFLTGPGQRSSPGECGVSADPSFGGSNMVGEGSVGSSPPPEICQPLSRSRKSSGQGARTPCSSPPAGFVAGCEEVEVGLAGQSGAGELEGWVRVHAAGSSSARPLAVSVGVGSVPTRAARARMSRDR